MSTTKSLQRTDLSRGNQRFGFACLQLATRENFPEGKIALHAGKLLVVLVDFSTALGTRHGERTKIAGDRIVLKILGLSDNMLGHVNNFFHEFLARHLPLLHERKLLFPVRRQLRRIQLRNAQPMQRNHERGRLGGRHEFASFAINVLLVEQPLNGSGTRCRRPQSFFLHGGSEFFVVNRFTRAFHGRKQCGFRIARRGFGRICFDLDRLGLDLFARLHRGQIGGRSFVVDLSTIHGQPTGVYQYLTL